MRTPTLLMIVGPTAVGKTTVSIRLAQHFGTEIVSADARQVYQRMPIGTAQPTVAEQRAVPHHLVHFLPVTQPYDVKQFERDALAAVAKVHQQRGLAVATGGSGLYVNTLVNGIDDMPTIPREIRLSLQQRWQQEGLPALLDDLKQADPAYFAVVDQQNHRRILRALEVYRSTGQPYSSFRHQATDVVRPFRTITIGLQRRRDLLYERINRRVDRMFEQGLEEEARALLPWRNYQALRTVGYQELFPVFDGHYDQAEAVRLIQQNTRRYAKRQLTWFRKDGAVRWFDMDPGIEPVVEAIISYVGDVLVHSP